MSDAGSNADGGAAAAPPTTSQFTERELQMLCWAIQSLKSGPPEIDYEKLAKFAGMSNPRSASNAWAKIKNKLVVDNGETSEKAATKATPKKKAATANGDGDGDKTPVAKKTPKKRASKKQEVDGEEGSPKKKGRLAKAKKAGPGPTVKDEPKEEPIDEADNDSNDAEDAADPDDV